MNSAPGYGSMQRWWELKRRDFLKLSAAASAGLVLGRPSFGKEQAAAPPARAQTNIDAVKDAPRVASSLPGPLPGRVVAVTDEHVVVDGTVDKAAVAAMFARGLQTLTGRDNQGSFELLLRRDDVVGIKPNPVGAGLISTRHEVVDAIIDWLTGCGLPRGNIVIWDRFESMLLEAGFTPERYPGVGIEALQIIDENFDPESGDTTGYLAADGRHLSCDRFDPEVVYWADCEAPQDAAYLNQHVFNDQRSPFGKLLTQRLTKIINVPVFKNTGNGISMATKNIGYGAIANTGRLHRPLFFDVCTEVLAFPVIRDKLVLNVTDGIRGQYDGGPGPNAGFIYDHKTLYLATDPIALDRTCHDLLVAKRKQMQVDVNEHPRFTEYLRYGERLGLGIADPARIEVVTV
ncbi:MAG: DUF362 domain-containing protein [Candidatus Krumholzibacteria bacterium]|nr:DUF362 domain-containing protein [Candidatus Krumholzibacteria bacterium]